MYDHISFHTEGAPYITPEQAAQHMGYYFAWAISQNLHSNSAAALPHFADVQAGLMSGADFVLQQLNGGLDETCFNALGNRFTQFYYEDEDEGYGQFMADYFAALDLQNEADLYQVTWQPARQQQLNAVFQQAFLRWKSSLRPVE